MPNPVHNRTPGQHIPLVCNPLRQRCPSRTLLASLKRSIQTRHRTQRSRPNQLAWGIHPATIQKLHGHEFAGKRLRVVEAQPKTPGVAVTGKPGATAAEPSRASSPTGRPLRQETTDPQARFNDNDNGNGNGNGNGSPKPGVSNDNER